MAQAQVEPNEAPTSPSELPASLDDKLERMFGGNTEEQPQTQEPEAQTGDEVQASTESTEDAQPEFVEVEIDGETWNVPPKIKERMLAHADYTKKTTETANARRAVEVQQKEIALYQEQRAFEQSVSADFDNLKMLDAYIQHTEKNTEWAKLTTDQIVRARLELDQLKTQRSDLAKALDGKRNEFEQKIRGEREKLKKESAEVVAKAIPNWNDETRGAVEKYAVSLGYPEIATAQMSALDYQVAWKAMQYDKIKAETKSAVKKAGEAPVVAQSARKTAMPKQVRAKLDLKNAAKSGNKAAINAALDKRLGQIFGG